MKKFIVLFREADGKSETHSQEKIKRHQETGSNGFKNGVTMVLRRK